MTSKTEPSHTVPTEEDLAFLAKIEQRWDYFHTCTYGEY